MKSRSVLIRVCIYIVMTFILIFLEPKVSNVLIESICLLIYIVAILVLVSWRTYNCIWVCDGCGEKFEVSLWASIKSFSIFSIKNKLYHRKLHCHKCNEKMWCRCIFKE